MNQQCLTNVFGVEFTDSKDNWKAKCPFHQEKTPSFYVHKEEGIAHCFGCDISGSIDTLASMHLCVSVEEAARQLEFTKQERIINRLGRHRDEDRPPQFFPISWLAPFKKELSKYVLNRGFSTRCLIEAQACYDKTKHRQVFPQFDQEGRLLGAVGRACADGGRAQPKWLFYWNYDKGKCLYRPFELTPLRPIIVVEGVFDLLWLRQNGVDNVCAPIGARITKEQADLLKREGNSFIVAFDNDSAGSGGCKDLHEKMRKTAQVRFVDWPSGTNDWMDLDKDQIHEVIDGAKTVVTRALSRGSRSVT